MDAAHTGPKQVATAKDVAVVIRDSFSALSINILANGSPQKDLFRTACIMAASWPRKEIPRLSLLPARAGRDEFQKISVSDYEQDGNVRALRFEDWLATSASRRAWFPKSSAVV